MKKTLFAAAAAAVLLTACQTEADVKDPANLTPPGGTINTTNPLTRYVESDGTDSTVINVTYDAAGRVTKFTGEDNGSVIGEIRLYRNANGLINRYVYVDEHPTQPGWDSTAYSVVSNASQYMYALTRANVQGVPLLDSAVVSYNASGTVVTVTSYGCTPLNGNLYEPYQRREYTFSGKNVTAVKRYHYNGSAWELMTTTNATYDAKACAITLGADGVLLDIPEWVGESNLLTEQEINPGPPQTVINYATTYTYTNFNKPATGTQVETPGGDAYVLRYTYK